jgi:pimeloyl-ACP methyl ester carboxylesterase
MPDPEPATTRVVVLVHGAWHGAWCWAALQSELDRRGVPSYALDLPGHGASTAALADLHGDADAVVEAIAAIRRTHDGGVVLVGHSYGGAVVTEAAARAPDGVIAHIVYVAGFALDDGESIITFLSAAPRLDVELARAVVTHADGTNTLDRTVAATALYGECPPDVAAAALARLCSQTVASWRQTVDGSPRGRISSTYVRCLRDKSIHPDHQRLLAARCDDDIELDTDHSPFLSRTTAVADVLEALARTAGPVSTRSNA